MFVSIRYKLFATLLTAVVIVAAGMFFLIHWSFNRNFQSYVNILEEKRIGSLANDLQKAFSSQKNWQFLMDNPHLWHQFLGASTPEGVQQFDPLSNLDSCEKRAYSAQFSSQGVRSHGRNNHEKISHDQLSRVPGHLFESRVVLLDAEKKLVAGPGAYPVDMHLVTLKQKSTVFGYLGHISSKNILAMHQLQFLQQQKKSFAFISFLIAILAAFIAVPVAGRMVRRINALAKRTHLMAAGQYDNLHAVGPSDELGQLTRDFNSLAVTLKKNEMLRKQWVADISHELRTPLAVLQGEIEAIQDGVRISTPEAMSSLHSEVLRLNRLVHDLFQLSMSEIGALTYRKENLGIVKTIAKSADIFAEEFAQKNIVLKLNIQDKIEGKMHIFGDPERLHQLFTNLLSNSLHHTDSEGILKIVCKLHDGKVEIIYQDSPPGVPEADIPRLFDRLFRVDDSRNRASGGAGLGLAICKNIVEAHNGTIRAAPSPLGGVLIRILIPIVPGV